MTEHAPAGASAGASQSTSEHRAAAASGGPISFGLVTVSDSRDERTDENGAFLVAEVERAGHVVAMRRIVPDDPPAIDAAIDEALATGCGILILNGGTGIAARDNSYDVIAARLHKTLPGFGELFRMLSWEQVGAASMLSRATAGTVLRPGGAPSLVAIALPGSPAAVRLAWTKLIEPEAAHLAWEVGR